MIPYIWLAKYSLKSCQITTRVTNKIRILAIRDDMSLLQKPANKPFTIFWFLARGFGSILNKYWGHKQTAKQFLIELEIYF